MCRAEAQRRVVAFLGLDHLTLFLERVRQIAVGIWEIWLELDRAPVRVDRQIDEPEMPVPINIVAPTD